VRVGSYSHMFLLGWTRGSWGGDGREEEGGARVLLGLGEGRQWGRRQTIVKSG
jgi:hypothetical protein